MINYKVNLMENKMLKINKNELKVLNVKNVDDHFDWLLEDMFWYDGDGVYMIESGGRWEMDVSKVVVDGDGNFEVKCMEDLKKMMGDDDDMIMSDFVDGVYNVVVGDECGYEYFYFKKGV